MKRRPPLRQHGLSLVELLLGLAITALVLAPLVPMLETASAAARITGEQAALEQEAAFALQRISARIRATTASTQLSASSDDWLKPAVYLVTNGALVEQQKGVNYVLAESVTAFSLSAPASAGEQPLIQVSLTLARAGASTTASAVVRMGGMR